MKKILPVILALLGCGSCNTALTDEVISSFDWEETTIIEYRYGDSSVAPDYHRSYVIAITNNSKTITIDSYGDVLLTKQYPNTSEDFQTFKGLLSKKGIKKHKEKDSEGCTGGTTETICLYRDETKFFDAYVYHCSDDYGTLLMPDGAADLIRSQIPESVELLINSTMQNN